MGERSAWRVESGDSLWSIAADTVRQRTGSAELEAVVQYWVDLIEANAEVIGGNPDLIHPGQTICLPD